VTVEFRPKRVEHFIAEIFSGAVGEKNDPVGVQRPECILKFFDGAIDIRKGQRRKVSEAIRPYRN